ncbi:MAG: hypothetical protein J6039_04345 [Alphaproteobacteria bacterium]|nr:hypothetical protein [Alphaproteobacteria bacterium]
MKSRKLPTIDEVVFAMSGEQILGEGEEATVYKIPTNPDYTVRVSKDAPAFEELAKKIFTDKFIPQEDIFEGRNYAQPVAYWGLNDDKMTSLVTINLYCPGISMEIDKSSVGKPTSEIALLKTMNWSRAIADMPNAAIDRLYDDLHFLSSREYSIDVCNGGLFTNTGNILYAGKEQEFRIIDIQPFIREHPGIKRNHTKGLNVPLNLCRGLLPGVRCYAEEHSKYPHLIEYRTEIVNKVINGAKRNGLSDLGGYSHDNMDSVAKSWEVMLRLLNIPEKYRDNFIQNICSVKDKPRYDLYKSKSLIRASNRNGYS